MKAYVGQGNMSAGAAMLARVKAAGLGVCVCPGEHPPLARPWFLDNGAFRDWTAKHGRRRKGKPRDLAWPFSDDGFARALSETREDAPDFVVAPDVVGGGMGSLALSTRWLDSLTGHRAFLAVQDGMDAAAVADALGGFAGLFVGGSLGWKLATAVDWVALAHRAGKPCHVGRVGTFERVLWAREIQADSIDSSLPLWTRDGFTRFVAALEGRVPDQRRLFA